MGEIPRNQAEHPMMARRSHDDAARQRAVRTLRQRLLPAAGRLGGSWRRLLVLRLVLRLLRLYSASNLGQLVPWCSAVGQVQPRSLPFSRDREKLAQKPSMDANKRLAPVSLPDGA